MAEPCDPPSTASNYTMSSRRLLLIQHTTTARRGLRHKWLAAGDGDVTKARAIADAERTRGTVRAAKLVLCCSIEPDQELIRAVHVAAGGDLEVDIWPGSRIADFLDRDPEGQWIRLQHFGVEAVRLSASQARDIALRSLGDYLPLVPREDIVERALDATLSAFARNSRGAGFVIGDSGVGKSAALRSLADRWLSAGGIALILDHSVIEEAATVEQAIALGLRKWEPTLEAGCGQVALSLASPEHPYLLIVEDINLSTNPRRIVERVIGWSKAGGKDVTEAGWRLLCPVWRGNSGLGDSRLRSHVLARSLTIEGFEPEEAMEAVVVRARDACVALTRLQAAELATALANDPLLIGLNSDWSAPAPHDAIQSYIEAQIAAAADDRLLASDLQSALDHCAERMVEKRSIAPSWEQIKEWHTSNPDHLAGLRRLLDQGRVVRLDTEERLSFRHDRVRDQLLVRAIVRLVEGDRFTPDLWSEPFYSGLIGAALSILPADRIEDAREHNPVAIFAALQDARIDGDRQGRLVAAAERWTTSPDFGEEVSEGLRTDAMRFLMRTDAPFVSTLAERFHDSFWKLEALARNGHAGAAAALCRTSYPGMRDPWRDRIIDHALACHPHFVDHVVALLGRRDLKGSKLEGVLNLAGEIGDPSLCDALASRWATLETTSLTTGWLWAALRCCPPIGHPLVNEICGAWAALPPKLGGDRDSDPRWDIAGYSLPWGLSRKPAQTTTAYLMMLSKRHRGLLPIVTTIISHIDAPEAIVWAAERSASIDRRIEGTGSINPMRSDFDRRWSPERDGRALSTESRAALAGLWRNRRRNRHARATAFRIWALTPTAAERAELPALEADAVLADQALRTRLAAGDRDAVPMLRRRLWGGGKRAWVWWYQSRHVSLRELEEDIRRYFSARRSGEIDRNSDHIVAELLMDARGAFSEAVIVDNWDQRATSPYFVQAALYLATPQTIALAQASVEAHDDPVRLLDHLTMHWGIRIAGRPGVIDLAQLQGVESLLAVIGEGQHGDMRIGDLFEAANRLGALAWRREHLDPLLAANKFGHCPSDREALHASLDAEVERAANSGSVWIRVDHWFEQREKEQLERGKLLEVVAEWASDRASELAARFLCESLTQFGERRDLFLIDELPADVRRSCATTISNCIYEVRRRSLQ